MEALLKLTSSVVAIRWANTYIIESLGTRLVVQMLRRLFGGRLFGIYRGRTNPEVVGSIPTEIKRFFSLPRVAP